MDIQQILGSGPGTYRIGVIALANDQVIERDLSRLLPEEVLTYTTRIAFGGRCTLADLAQMAPIVSDAARLLNPEVELDAVVFGCTSGTLAIGPGKIKASVQGICPTAQVINPVDAACSAFERLGVKRLNLVTPYEPELAGHVAEAFALRGFEILHRFDFGLEDSSDISRVKPEAILAAATSLPDSDAEATFISCTDFQSLTVLQEIEEITGHPAISSNQAVVWSVLDMLGLDGNLTGFGRLLGPAIQQETDKQQHGAFQ
ncbi:maleate cis-trans isomerase family protein [Roseibium sp. SCP14]|uniref:maleate cis-trans isomerase family protein n=1 Tax=Roseibium sp. SCP14 TaxID=3141375 RepID=UPI0033387D3F